MILTKLVWSFVAGALSVSTLSVTADRFGSRLAGVLAGFPATVAASLLIIALNGDLNEAVAMAKNLPLSMGFLGIFLAVYCACLEKGLVPALSAATLSWFCFSSLPLAFGPPPWIAGACVFTLIFAGSYHVIEHVLHVVSRPGVRTALSLSQLVMRLLLGGGVVTAAVYLSSASGPVMGALAIAFPAVTATTLVVTYHSGGAKLSAAVAKSLLVSGMLNAAVYSSAVVLLYPALGAVAGTFASLLVLIGSGMLSYRWVHALD